MKASQLPKKFLSIRDKNGSHRRSKSLEPGHKARPLSAEAFFSIFKTEAAKQAAKEEAEREKEGIKIDDISRRLVDMNITDITRENISYALTSKFASGDIDKAMELLQLQKSSFAGTILPHNPNTAMLGAENRGNVTCYLDALLFAMFSKLEAFECMLKNEFTSEPQRQLAALLRLWVNMLRTGKLIQINMTQHIQDALAACGWKEAKLLEQQDTSEAFAFITETLQLPLLTLQVDLFHQGKNDADDHKVVYERLLNLAVPPDPEGKGIRLEDCLEEYFNAQVDVLRDSLEEKKSVAERNSISQKATIRMVAEEDDAGAAGPSEGEAAVGDDLGALPPRRVIAPVAAAEPADGSQSSTSLIDPPPPRIRHRSTSIIQRIVLDDEGRPTDADGTSVVQRAKRKGSTIVKAVTIPAWQFFKLIPWHATSEGLPKNDVDVVRQFNQRPVLGICLKRYMMTKSGMPKRQNTFIDIPDSMRLPHFMMLDEKPEMETNGLSTEYKLVLQSVVCHRGESLHSGHYISFCRIAPKLLTDNRRHSLDPPPDYEEAQWVKFDDLMIENRVSYVDDIKKSLREEMPYLLFYQIVPTVDVTTQSETSETEPPSYNDSTVNIAGASDANTTDTDSARMTASRRTSGYFDAATAAAAAASATGAVAAALAAGPSARVSAEMERRSRRSFQADDDASLSALASNPSNNTGSTTAAATTASGGGGDASSGSRRPSISFSEATGITTPGAATTPDAVPTTPALTPGEDAGAAAAGSSTAQRLSRAASRFGGSRSGGGTGGGGGSVGGGSRPASQAGEGRISITMSRLGGLMRPSREPLRDAAAAPPPPQPSGAVTPGSITPGLPSDGTDPGPADEQAVASTLLGGAVAQGGGGGGGGGALDIPQTDSAATTPATTPGATPGSVSGGHHLHHHHHGKKDRGKSKSRASGAEKDKDKEKAGRFNKQGLPERECTVM